VLESESDVVMEVDSRELELALLIVSVVVGLSCVVMLAIAGGVLATSEVGILTIGLTAGLVGTPVEAGVGGTSVEAGIVGTSIEEIGVLTDTIGAAVVVHRGVTVVVTVQVVVTMQVEVTVQVGVTKKTNVSLINASCGQVDDRSRRAPQK